MLDRTTASYLVGEFANLTDDQYAQIYALALVRCRGIAQASGTGITSGLIDQTITLAAGHMHLRSLATTAGSAGPLTSFSAGNTSMSFGAPQLTGAPDDYWRATGYGVQYLALRDSIQNSHRIR